MQLFSRTNHFLAIYSDGTIKGTQDRVDPHCTQLHLVRIFNFNATIISAHLEVISAHFPGHVKIRGMATNFYVTMNENGKIYGQVLEFLVQE